MSQCVKNDLFYTMVLFIDFHSDGLSQLNLFYGHQSKYNNGRLMELLDGISYSMKGKILFTGQGIYGDTA